MDCDYTNTARSAKGSRTQRIHNLILFLGSPKTGPATASGVEGAPHSKEKQEAIAWELGGRRGVRGEGAWGHGVAGRWQCLVLVSGGGVCFKMTC